MKLKSYTIELPFNKEHYFLLSEEISRQKEFAENLGLDVMADYYEHKLILFNEASFLFNGCDYGDEFEL